MPLYQKFLIGCVGLILAGFLLVGAMVLFGLAISQPAQRRLQASPRERLARGETRSSGASYTERRCDPPSTTS